MVVNLVFNIKKLIKINYKLYIFNKNYVGIFIINPNCF